MNEIEVLRSTLSAARSANLAALHALDSALSMISGDYPTPASKPSVEAPDPVVEESEGSDGSCPHLEVAEVRGMGVKVCADCGANLPIV